MMALSVIMGMIFGAFRHVKNQSKTKGTIIEVEYTPSASNRRTYKALAEYTVEGKVYHVKSTFRSSSFRTGGKIPVCYNKMKPEEAFFRISISFYFAKAFFFFFGLAVLLQNYHI
jgi:hypothetical protein